MFENMDKIKEAVKTVWREMMQEDPDADLLKIRKLNEELENLKLKRRLDDTEIKALMKIEQEKSKLELEGKKIELEGQYQKKEMELMKDYHQKTLQLLAKNEEMMNKTYNEIMKRLPNVNVALGNGKKEG